MEKYSCWSVLLIDGLEVEAKILHKGRGKFRIVEDNCTSKYVNRIVDGSDVILCKLEHDEVRSFIMRNKLAGLEPSVPTTLSVLNWDSDSKKNALSFKLFLLLRNSNRNFL